MPIYEYECEQCRKYHEIMQKITDSPLSQCPACGGTLRKMISNTSFVLKGSGWYATDYAAHAGKSKETDTAESSVESQSQSKDKKESQQSNGKDSPPEKKEIVTASS